MSALQKFLKDELHRRDWSIEEFSRRARMSTSSGYLIVRDGKDNVRQDTFEGIASAFKLTPAELMIAIGKGPVGTNPQDAVMNALIREMPEEHKPAATFMLSGLVHAKSHLSDVAKTAVDIISTRADPDDDQSDDTLRVWYRGFPTQSRVLAVAGS